MQATLKPIPDMNELITIKKNLLTFIELTGWEDSAAMGLGGVLRR